jgi:hypothetical protein
LRLIKKLYILRDVSGIRVVTNFYQETRKLEQFKKYSYNMPTPKTSKNATLIIMVFAACAFAFWVNFGNRLARIETEARFRDSTNSTGASEKNRLTEGIAAFREHYGVTLIIHIDHQPRLPQLDSSTLFIGVVPARREENMDIPAQTRFVYPALLERALNPDVRALLGSELGSCVENSPIGQCLVKTVSDMLSALAVKPL